MRTHWIAVVIAAGVCLAPVARGDTTDDTLAGLDPFPAADAPLDMQISIDGFDLFSTAGNSASATSNMGDIGWPSATTAWPRR